MSDKVAEARAFISKLASETNVMKMLQTKAIHDRHELNRKLDESLRELAGGKREFFTEKIQLQDLYVLIYETLDNNQKTYFTYKVVDSTKGECYTSDFRFTEKEHLLLYASIYLTVGKESHHLYQAVEMLIAGFKKMDSE